MRGHGSYSLLVIRGDGARVVRLNVPRPAVKGALVALAVALSLLVALLCDWAQLRELTREAKAFGQQIAEQRATIDSFNRRVADLRREIRGWRDIHARIWEPFGPGFKPGPRDKGMGGGTSTPDRAAALVTPQQELDRLTEAVTEQGESLRALDRLMARAGRALAALPSRWPVRGAVNSEFGTRSSPWTAAKEFHGGLDIRAEKGTPVRAPGPGTVAFAGVQSDFGVTAIVDHGQDVRTIYAHLSKLSVRQGERVERGAVIGLSGNTGRSSGPHLHYEIHVKGQPVNPRAYLWD